MKASRLKSLAGSVLRFLRDDRGLIALKFALMVPGVAVLGLGAVDLHAVYSDRQKMQDIADAAALAGARELGLAVAGAVPEERARAYVDAQVGQWRHGPTIETQVTALDIDGQRALRVRLEGNRPSFFGNLLPPGGWNLAAESTASSVAVTPLCVLAHGEGTPRVIHVRDNGQIRAPACLVHSNQDILVQGGSISAAMTEAVTSAQGSISPAAATGAVEIPDPFQNLELVDEDGEVVRAATACVSGVVPRILIHGRHRLPAGVHCGGTVVAGTAELELAPGEHWFLLGPLVTRDDAQLTGEDVALFFDRMSTFNFMGRSRVSLDGRESGPYAGMVMVATRDNQLDFGISADHVEALHGVIYVPSARLIVQGRSDVARESAWTVIVARKLQLRGSPRLFMNADYDSSPVPVPTGVGPREGGSRLLN